ncbi:MAG: glycosyltransferase family 4 protein [Candidatus Nealsonbacteria bacterium]|nr:MAG: glycosyltransferase family 4 protein [Candidatus Nealsonbacteria bacterium]
MKILHIVNYFQPKLGYQETFLAKKHRDFGHEVHVITSNRYFPFPNYDNLIKPVLGSRYLKAGNFVEENIVTYRLEVLFEIKKRVWLIGLEKKIRELKPDIIFLHGVSNINAIRVGFLKKRNSKQFKLIYDDHMLYVVSKHKLRKLFYLIFKLFFSKLLIQSADGFIACNNGTKKFMNDCYGIPLDLIVTIPLGADKDLFRFNEKSRDLIRNKLGVEKQSVIFIYAGKITPKKGPDLLVKAGLELTRKYKNFKILLLGDSSSEYIKFLKKLIREKKGEEFFIWLPTIYNKELPKYYSSADIGVWPRESSLTMLEAQACNLPIIVSDSVIAGASDRILNNNGLTFKDGDYLDLAKKMESLILDKELRIKMGKRGRKLVEEKFNWGIIAKQFIDLAS